MSMCQSRREERARGDIALDRNVYRLYFVCIINKQNKNGFDSPVAAVRIGTERGFAVNRAEEWWRREAIYQIYPRSFQDTNGDGVGDLQGVIRRLDYLRWLGVGGIWLSPIFTSPMVDFGYDVADYCDIDPAFGSLADFDELIIQAHRRDMKVILDFVPNHTSDRHRWFLESRSDRANPLRDRYIWKDAEPDGSPPNNWLCISTGESAWVWDERTGQYFLATFTPNQPDLNWRSDATRRAMHDVLRFGWSAARTDFGWI